MKSNQEFKKNLPLIMWFIFITYILYGTFIPFDFSFQLENLSKNIERANFIPFYDEYEGRRFSITDIVGNLLLFLPYGFFLYWGLQKRNIGTTRCKLICILSAFLFSSIIEFLQLFSISRKSAITDIINNTASAWIGCILSNIYLISFRDKLCYQLSTLRRENPLLIFLTLYSLLIFVGFMFPFDISIAVEDIKRGIKEINLIPFYYHREINLSLVDIGVNFFPFVIFGFMGYTSLRIYYYPKVLITVLITTCLGFCLASIIEFSHIFIVSRVSDITEMIIRVIGVLLGILISFINYYGK